MRMPDLCFCGCGEQRDKLDTTNIDGITLTYDLSWWLLRVEVLKRAGRDVEWLTAPDSFMADGATIYRTYLDEVHGGVKVDRGMRKEYKRWKKFSKKGMKKITRADPGLDQLEWPPTDELPAGAPPLPVQVREWVLNGTPIRVLDT